MKAATSIVHSAVVGSVGCLPGVALTAKGIGPAAGCGARGSEKLTITVSSSFGTRLTDGELNSTNRAMGPTASSLNASTSVPALRIVMLVVDTSPGSNDSAGCCRLRIATTTAIYTDPILRSGRPPRSADLCAR